MLEDEMINIIILIYLKVFIQIREVLDELKKIGLKNGE